MSKLSDSDLKHFRSKYKDRLEGEFDPDYNSRKKKTLESREFVDFVNELRPGAVNWYEKACNISEKIIRINPDKNKAVTIQESIDMAGLAVTPSGVESFGILAPIVLIVFGGMFSFILFESMFLLIFCLFAGLAIMTPLRNMINYFAAQERMKASNQMVQCIFYVVTYMRHTSNLEKAIEFASEHLMPPLSNDLKKVIWNVETEEFESVRESLDSYLQKWRHHNMEFVEAFHLIESSLYESSNERRLALLDKSLDVILDETYEKMLHYAQNLKSPITTLHMLGVIMPILGLVILPLVVSFMPDVRWYHLSVLYNISLPLLVYFMGKNILISRPSGYGETDMSTSGTDSGPALSLKIGKESMLSIPTIFISLPLLALFILIGLSPLIIYAINPTFDIVFLGESLLGYKPSMEDPNIIKGPYGMGASLLSFFIPLGLAFSIGLYYNSGAKETIKIRNESKKLEQEFASSLFQLGNRLGDGLPTEIAFLRVAEVMEGTISGKFFQIVAGNIQRLGMGVEEAIFNTKVGALAYFPSSVIQSSMKVLTQSAKKGPQIAAQALLNVSRYIKEIHRVDERLKDLMADTISSMKSQIKFLTPVISGIVIGITAMITSIIGKLGTQLQGMGGDAGQAASLAEMFSDGLPTYYFQIIVGIYVVQIVFILTQLANSIENGTDRVSEHYNLGVNMLKSPFLYAILAIIVMVIFNSVAGQVLTVTNR